VAGSADLLVVPGIESGNILYKALAFLTSARHAGLILGARVPIVLTSRADAPESKVNSLALAAYASRRG
jgi:phosphate butyryltransferase